MEIKNLVLAIVLGAAVNAEAADYYLFKDASGTTWISNQDLRNKDESAAPRRDDVSVVKHYQWHDVTDEQLAASAVAERQLVEINALRDMAMQTERLANELAQQRLEPPAQDALSKESNIIVNTGRAPRVHQAKPKSQATDKPKVK
jgi:hypothetical protein